jgi:hypothetical protein
MESIPFRGLADHRRVSHLCPRRHLLIICAAVALAVAYGPVAQADLSYGPSYSLTTLTNSGETILVGDKIFSNFFTFGDSYASNITVTALTSDGNYGLAFTGGFAADYGNPMDFTIGYMVGPTNGSGNLISGADLAFNGQVYLPPGDNGALASVTETVLTNMDAGTPYGVMSVYSDPQTNVLSTNMVINPAQPYLNLSKDVLVDSFTITAYASISEIDQLYMQIPEPSTIAMEAIAGVAALLLLRRRRR